MIMTHDAAPAIAPGTISVLHRIPVPRMRINHQPAPGAVTGQTHVAVCVAGLAGLEIPARLPSVVGRPDMLRQQSSGMAGLALGSGEGGMGGAGIAYLEVGPCPSVRLHHEVFAPEFRVALAAVAGIVTPHARLGVIERLQGMDLAPIRSMAVRDVICPVVVGL